MYIYIYTCIRIYIYICMYVYIVEYYSAIKRNKFESVLVMWIKLEPVEASQKEKNKYHILTHI